MRFSFLNFSFMEENDLLGCASFVLKKIEYHKIWKVIQVTVGKKIWLNSNQSKLNRTGYNVYTCTPGGQGNAHLSVNDRCTSLSNGNGLPKTHDVSDLISVLYTLSAREILR